MSAEIQKDYIESLERRTQHLWELSVEKTGEWQQYFLRYHHEGLRWLIALAVGLAGIGSFLPEEKVNYLGGILLIAFIIFAIIFDSWRSGKVLKGLSIRNNFTNKVFKELRHETDQLWLPHYEGKLKDDDLLAFGKKVKDRIENWEKGPKRRRFDPILDKVEEVCEFLLYILFVLGLLIFVGPTILNLCAKLKN